MDVEQILDNYIRVFFITKVYETVYGCKDVSLIAKEHLNRIIIEEIMDKVQVAHLDKLIDRYMDSIIECIENSIFDCKENMNDFLLK